MSNDEEYEAWFRNLNLYDADPEVDSLKMDELIEKAKKDPFYNKALRKSKTKKESKEKKEFSGYNWTTHKKKIKGLTAKIKELKEIEKPSEEEKYTLKRVQTLLKWHRWALKHHKDGKSDKWIHEETQKRRKEAKASK